jgi:hypothetical protein
MRADEVDVKKEEGGRPTFRPPSNRHFLDSLSLPKAAGNSVFVIPRGEVAADVAEINAGSAPRSGTEFTTSSGRIYSYHDDILYPVRGPGIEELPSHIYNLLKQLKGDPDKGQKSIEKQREKGIISAEDAERTLRLARLAGFI